MIIYERSTFRRALKSKAHMAAASQHRIVFAHFLHLLLVCIPAALHKTVDSCSKCFVAVSFMTRLTSWLLILGSYASAAGQTGLSGASSTPDWGAGLLSSFEQCEKDKSPQALSPQILLTAKTVFVIGDPLGSDPASKAGQTLKKALVKWGRFSLVDDAETADLIIVIWDYSSSKPTRTERISEGLAVFTGGSTNCANATPLWAVKEVGPVLGQRPTRQLVDDLRKQLTTLEKSFRASGARSPT